jgi:hypothetical protein
VQHSLGLDVDGAGCCGTAPAAEPAGRGLPTYRDQRRAALPLVTVDATGTAASGGSCCS